MSRIDKNKMIRLYSLINVHGIRWKNDLIVLTRCNKFVHRVSVVLPIHQVEAEVTLEN